MFDLSACSLDLDRGVVIRGEDRVQLTTREAELVRYFVAHPGAVVSRDELLREVWGYADTVVSRACDNAVRRLREKIEAEPTRPDHLLTVHGVGYRFVPPGAPTEAPAPSPSARVLIQLDRVRIDVTGRRVLRAEGEVDLTETEARVLEALLQVHGAVVDRRTLVRAGWGTPASGRLVDNVIRRLRTKIEADPDRPRFLHTVRRSGYRLDRPPEPRDSDLVGRDALTADALERCRTDRWVLLVGPGGVGKSRLARELAARASRTVVWVELAAARTAIEAATAVARQLDLELGAADPVDRVAHALARRPNVLVVLDNLEGLGADGATLINRWLQAAPLVHFLGTSRVRVGASDEELVEVGPLDPASAVSLFLRRARAAATAAPDLDLVRTLVDRVDRMPLAIELAAARTRVLGLPDLLARLSVDLLSTPLAVDPRVASVRRAVEASLDALPGDAVDAVAQLSLFRGGFDVEDAEGLLGANAIDLVQTLRDHSLLHSVPDRTGALRLVTWTSVAEVLDEQRDPGTLRRHCQWVGRMADGEQLERLLCLGGEEGARRQIAATDEAVHATWLAIGLGDPLLAGRCAVMALWGLSVVGPNGGGVALGDAVLRLPVDGLLRARILSLRGQIYLNASRLAEARADVTAAAALAAEFGDWDLERSAWLTAHTERYAAGDPVASRACLLSAREAAERAGKAANLALVDAFLAEVDGQNERAAECFAAVRRAVGTDGPRRALSHALRGLGLAAGSSGRLREALGLFEADFAVSGGIGLAMAQAVPLANILQVLVELGEGEQVDRWAARGLSMADELHYPVLETTVRLEWATSLLWRGDLERASAQLDAIDALSGEASFEMTRAWTDLGRTCIEVVRGDAELGLQHATRAMETFRKFGHASTAAIAQRWRALAALALGDVSEARAHAEQSVIDCGSRGSQQVSALCVRARVAAAEGDVTGAAALFDRARALADGDETGRSGTEAAFLLARAWNPPHRRAEHRASGG